MAIQFKAGKPEDAPAFHVPAGDYQLRVIEAQEDTSKAGNEMIRMKLRVIKDDGTDGPTMFDYLVFSEASFWKVDAFLKACDRHPGEGKVIDIESEDCIGWECEATLLVETYDGKKQNKVAAYLFDSDGF